MPAYHPDGKLVHTPPTKAREGLLGYILRISEANGYETPWTILWSQGLIRRGKPLAAVLPIDKLSQIIGRSVEELRQLPWSSYPDGNPAPLTTKGTPQLLRHLRLMQPKICPCCVAERGVVDAAWDLRIMLACPTHGVALLDHCPTCHNRLSWYRRGLNRCQCGHEFTMEEQRPVPQHTSDLLRVIDDTLYGILTDPNPVSGIPAADLQRMGIDDLLKLLARFATVLLYRGQNAVTGISSYDLELLIRLSGIFENWPNQFLQFLHTIDREPTNAAIGLPHRFGNFHNNIIIARKIGKEKVHFLRKAFGQYGSLSNAESRIDPRYFLTPAQFKSLREQGFSASQIRSEIDGVTPKNLVNQKELARRLGVRPQTADSWAQHGRFGLKIRVNKASGQSEYEVPEELPKRVIAHGLTAHSAKTYLGIPQSMLQRLRRDGYYPSQHIGRKFAQFSKPDLDALHYRFLACASKELSSLPEKHVTLAECLRMRLNGTENKYRLLSSILDGAISPIGRLGNSIGDLVLACDTVETFRQTTTPAPMMSVTVAAKHLDCDRAVVPGLFEIGALEGEYKGSALYLTVRSVNAFRAKFASCAHVAKKLGTSSRYVTRRLSECGIKLLFVPRRNSKAEHHQAFLRQSKVQRVVEILRGKKITKQELQHKESELHR